MTLKDDLIAYYDFEIDNNPVIDRIGIYDMNVTGATFDKNDGIIGSSYLFDNVNDVLENENLLASLKTGLSIQFWFKHIDTFNSGKSTKEYFFEKINVHTFDFIYSTLNDSDGKLTFSTEEHNNGLNTISTSQDSWTAGVWYHVVLTWGATNGKRIYINRVVDANDAAETTILNEGTFRGFNMANVSPFNNEGLNDANIDEFAVWERELTQEEVTQLYNNGNGLALSFILQGKQATIGEKEIKTNWPVETGLVAGTTKQRAGNKFLSTGVKSLVPDRLKVGL